MTEYSKASVMLYGGKGIFGGREEPLVADIVQCRAESCQLKDDGKCVMVRNLSYAPCPHGRVDKVKGYTSRARKYREFKKTYKDDPLYGALDSPRDAYLRRADGWAMVNVKYLGVRYVEPDSDGQKLGKTGRIRVDETSFAFSLSSEWFPEDELDAESIVAICAKRPRYFMSFDTIMNYQRVVVPAFMDDLMLFWPERYKEVVELNPELGGLSVDYRGRWAKVLTLAQGSVIKDCHGNAFELRGDALVCDDFNSALVGPAGVKVEGGSLSIPVRDEHEVEIKDNAWVIPGHTVFR